MKNLPRSKVVMSLLLIGIAAIIIGGATSAWFTDDAEVADATFTAGTVIVDAEGPNDNYKELNRHLNVNPGDCGTIEWNIVNNGSKAAYLRVHLTEEWTNVELKEGLPDNRKETTAEGTDPFYFLPPDNSGWVMYDPTPDEDDGVWLYYKNEVPGTFDPETGERSKDPSSVPLKLVYQFDGAEMDNRYQDAGLTLGGIVVAIQSSNGAPEAEWGDDFTTAMGEGYSVDGAGLEGEAFVNWDYFHNPDRAGYNSICWLANNGGGGPVEPKYNVFVQIEGDGTVSGNNSPYEEGDMVELVASANQGSEFKGWEVVNDPSGSLSEPSGTNFRFEMPANDVTVKAKFEEKPAPPPDDFDIVVTNVKKDNGDTEITLKIENYIRNGQLYNGSRQVTIEGKVYQYGSWRGPQTLSNSNRNFNNGNTSSFTVEYDDRGVTGTSNVKLRVTIGGITKYYNCTADTW